MAGTRIWPTSKISPNDNEHRVFPPAALPEWLRIVRNPVEHLRFGVAQIVVHEHQVVQVERTEKVRFDKPEKRREK